MQRRVGKRGFDPWDTTDLARQVKTVIVAGLSSSVLLIVYSCIVGYIASLEPDMSAMLLDGMMTWQLHLSEEGFLVLVISGGSPESSTSIELFMPSRRSQCSLPNLPVGVTGHSQNRWRQSMSYYDNSTTNRVCWRQDPDLWRQRGPQDLPALDWFRLEGRGAAAAATGWSCRLEIQGRLSPAGRIRGAGEHLRAGQLGRTPQSSEMEFASGLTVRQVWGEHRALIISLSALLALLTKRTASS